MLSAVCVLAGWGMAEILLWAAQGHSLRKGRTALLSSLPARLRKASGALRAGQHPVSVQEALLAECGCTLTSELPEVRFKKLAFDRGLAVFGQMSTLAQLRRREGIDLAAGWDGVADRIDLVLKARSLAQVATAPIRAQSRLVMFVLPVLVLMVFLFEPDATQQLFTTQAGLLVLGVCGLISVGMQWGFSRAADFGVDL